MCGIAGFLGDFPAQILDVMSDAIKSRGPDGAGQFHDERAGAGLAHRRLAIIDLSPGGAQPMRDVERGVTLSYNGEVYNFQELRAELAAGGHQFKSHSDTEVVLRAYLEWGDEAFNRLKGIFALAIWDEPRQEMLLVRDHIGVKPLYWAETPRRIVFASELKALIHAKDLDRTIDQEALYSYLIHLWSPGGAHTFRSG